MGTGWRIVIFVVLLTIKGTAGFARLIRVPTDHQTIQKAIDMAANGDEIVVSPGRCMECINFKGKAITVRSTDPADRTVVAATIIHGKQQNSVVTFTEGEKETSILSGFTITNGYSNAITASGDRKTLPGGGVCCYNSSPTLAGNVINDNSAQYCGGGVWCFNSSPTLIGNTITNNRAFSGGGIFCTESSSPTVANNTITGNTSLMEGGGISCLASSPALTSNIISGNVSISGGGIYCGNSSSPVLKNNVISHNKVNSNGGGIWCKGSSPSLINNTIAYNQGSKGVGLYCGEGSSPTLSNTIVAYNENWGLYFEEWASEQTPRPLITYCNFWGNKGLQPGSNSFKGCPDLTDSNGNISVEPHFADAQQGDFHLKFMFGRWHPATLRWITDTEHSACIDAGDEQSLFDEEPKPNGGRTNMGAWGNTPKASKSQPGPGDNQTDIEEQRTLQGGGQQDNQRGKANVIRR
jgi:parallel beta-helix repeat protein